MTQILTNELDLMITTIQIGATINTLNINLRRRKCKCILKEREEQN